MLIYKPFWNRMRLSKYHNRLLNKKYTVSKKNNPPHSKPTQSKQHTPQQTFNLDSQDWLNVYGIIYYAGVLYRTYFKSQQANNRVKRDH